MNIFRFTIGLMLLIIQYTGATFAQNTKFEIRGIYGHPQKIWDKGYKLNTLGVNAVFLHHKSITPTFMERARNEGQKIYAEFATLNGEGYVENHPEAWAIDDKGTKVRKASWFMGVCPTDTGFQKFRLEELNLLLTKYDIDGVWLDYLHWHAQFEDPEPILPETCFNESCTGRFEKETGITIPEGSVSEKAAFILSNHESQWRMWRATVIADWVKKCRSVLKQRKPKALLGIYHCPWDDREYDSARTRILALDYELLKPHADVFSPMVYHARMQRTPEWVKENIEWFTGKINDKKIRIWPIVQAYNDPRVVPANEFEKVLRFGMSGNASGVMMFTSSSVADDDQKINVLEKVYRGN